MNGNMTGTVFNNRYELTERIGVGGMAEVYQAQDKVLGRRVAVKVMLSHYADDEEFTQRFRQEAAAAANLQSPYIVNVYDWGQDGGTYYIVMEYVRGSDLKTAITQRGAINQRKVAEIGAQVCQALSVAHNQDIVHRDIKPQNIMVQPDGNVKVMDFGIARAKNSMMTKTSAVLGTAHYISPEQAQGKELTVASDIYSLGVVMYEAATGQLPFDGPDSVSVAMKQVSEAPVLPSSIKPDIDPALEAVIMRAMEKDPRARFATVSDMKHALNDFLAGRPVQVEYSGVVPAQNGFASPANYPAAENQFVANTSVMPSMGNGSASYVNQPHALAALEEQEAKRKGRRRAGLIALLLLLLAAAGGAWWYFSHQEPEPVTVGVPDVSSKTVAEAQQILSERKLKVGGQTEEFHKTIESGRIIATRPVSGTAVTEGDTVDLIVSKGRDEVEVPPLEGLTGEAAIQALEAAGFKAQAGTAQYSDTVPGNIVIGQNPVAGTMVERGGTITYVLSLGQETFGVPSVLEESEATAVATLRNAGFEVEIGYDHSDTVPFGLVMHQTPSAVEHLPKGGTVSIIISQGPSAHSVSASVVDTSGMASLNASVAFSEDQVDNGDAVSFWISVATGYEIVSVVDNNGINYDGNSGLISNVTRDMNLVVTIRELPKPEPEPVAPSSSQQAPTTTGTDAGTDTGTDNNATSGTTATGTGNDATGNADASGGGADTNALAGGTVSAT